MKSSLPSGLIPFSGTGTLDPAASPSSGHGDFGTATVTGPHLTRSSKPHPLPIVPGYRIVVELGHGGMGEVYEAVDEKLGITYALKMIRRDKVGLRYVERFRREARTMIDLNHPNIARIYGYGEIEDGPYFTMKFLPDGTLADKLESTNGNPRKAVEMMIKVARAVHYLHTKNYIHRDLKPQNILFQGDEPFVSDFGLAKEQGEFEAGGGYYDPILPVRDTDDMLSEAKTRVQEARPSAPTGLLPTIDGGIVGTLPYMSPEQLLGLRERISPKTDIWALGVLLYELICGRRPFDADDREVLSELIKQAEPHQLAIGSEPIDTELERVIRKCLAKNPDERYGSVAALIEDLQAWLTPPMPVPPQPFSPRWIYPLVAAIAVMMLCAVALPRPARSPEPQTVLPAPEDPERDADQQRKKLRESLAAGRPFTPLGAKGLPLTGVRMPIAGRPGEVIALDNGGILIDSVRRAALELIDDPFLEEYIFRVQIRQAPTANMNAARVGIYVGHQIFVFPTGKLHLFTEFIFSEGFARDPAARSTFVCNVIGRWQNADDDSHVAENLSTGLTWRGTFPPRMQRDEYTWRDIAVEVRKKEVLFFIDGKKELTIPRDFPAGLPKKLEGICRMQGQVQFPTTMPARAGLGLTVSQGSAEFRNATIEPIKASE